MRLRRHFRWHRGGDSGRADGQERGHRRAGRFLGGLTTGGLGATDIGNKAAIGGIAREFYARIAEHYAQDAAWKFEKREEYFAKRRAAGKPPGRR